MSHQEVALQLEGHVQEVKGFIDQTAHQDLIDCM